MSQPSNVLTINRGVKKHQVSDESDILSVLEKEPLIVLGAGISAQLCRAEDVNTVLWGDLLYMLEKQLAAASIDLKFGEDESYLEKSYGDKADAIYEKLNEFDSVHGNQLLHYIVTKVLGGVRLNNGVTTHYKKNIMFAIESLGLKYTTTNYECLIEYALDMAVIEALSPCAPKYQPKVPSNFVATFSNDFDNHCGKFVPHLHGLLYDIASTHFVFSTKQYSDTKKEFLVKLKSVCAPDPSDDSNRKAERGLLFIGCGEGIFDAHFNPYMTTVSTVTSYAILQNGDQEKNITDCNEGKVTPCIKRLNFGGSHDKLIPYLWKANEVEVTFKNRLDNSCLVFIDYLEWKPFVLPGHGSQKANLGKRLTKLYDFDDNNEGQFGYGHWIIVLWNNMWYQSKGWNPSNDRATETESIELQTSVGNTTLTIDLSQVESFEQQGTFSWLLNKSLYPYLFRFVYSEKKPIKINGVELKPTTSHGAIDVWVPDSSITSFETQEENNVFYISKLCAQKSDNVSSSERKSTPNDSPQVSLLIEKGKKDKPAPNGPILNVCMGENNDPSISLLVQKSESHFLTMKTSTALLLVSIDNLNWVTKISRSTFKLPFYGPKTILFKRHGDDLCMPRVKTAKTRQSTSESEKLVQSVSLETYFMGSDYKVESKYKKYPIYLLSPKASVEFEDHNALPKDLVQNIQKHFYKILPRIATITYSGELMVHLIENMETHVVYQKNVETTVQFFAPKTIPFLKGSTDVWYLPKCEDNDSVLKVTLEDYFADSEMELSSDDLKKELLVISPGAQVTLQMENSDVIGTKSLFKPIQNHFEAYLRRQ